MRPIALDTNAYAAFKRGDADIVAVLRHSPSIIVCVTVLGELLGGFAAGQRESINRSELARFINTPRVKVVPGTAATADLYALVYAALRR
jgi:predicted nucleic acid-binding protein